METRVTFVMPAYNAERFIAKAIESIQAQSIADWRLIIVNDGSSDLTSSIAHSFADKDSRISVFDRESNSGSVLSPRKDAIMRASTEFVSPLDADDWIEKDYLADLLRRQDMTNADIVYPAMWGTTGENDPAPKILVPKEEQFYQNVYRGKETVKHTLDGWKIGAGGGIIRKSVYLEAFNKFGSDFSHGYGDELITRFILYVADRVAFSHTKYFYRENPESVTHVVSPKKFHFLINDRHLIDFCRNNFSVASEEFILAHRQNFHDVFNALRMLNKSDLSDEWKKEVMRMIAKSRMNIDRDVIKKCVSPRYRFLLNFPLRVTSIILGLYDRIKK